MNHRSRPRLLPRHVLLSIVALCGFSGMNLARADVIFQETFATGLGQFTSTGSVSTTTGAARLRGSLTSNDGAITSSPINAQGFTDLSLSFDRSTSGLDLGEAGVASVSINGGAFVTLESTRTSSGRATFPLNMYQKVGMFAENTQTSAPFLGDQIRGFGYDNSGASGTVSLFLSAPVFTLNATQRSQVEQFVLALPSDMNPIVGQQVTVRCRTSARAG